MTARDNAEVLYALGQIAALLREVQVSLGQPGVVPAQRPWSVKAYAEHMGVGEQTVRDHLKLGTIKGHRIGRRWLVKSPL